MVAMSTPLEQYLQRQGIGKNPDDPRFWQVFKAGLDEFYGHFPEVDGVLIRIGEAGKIYSREGWDYWSELIVRTPQALQAMLRAFLEVSEQRGRTVIFRTWSVGIGKVGKMHTQPDAYERALEGIDSPALIVATKWTMGDYWSYLPLNPTLFQGRHKRMIEFQVRREFEAFNAFPNYLGPQHQAALQRFLDANPNIVGAWMWTHNGGPLFQAPFAFYRQQGLWLWMDANLYATAQLVRNPNADMTKLTAEWVRKELGSDPEMVRTMTALLLQSHDVTRAGLTFAPFARQQVFALGQEVPTVAFSYWNIVGGNSSIFSYLYQLARDSDGGVEGVLAQDQANLQRVAAMRADFERIRWRIQRPAQDVALMGESLAYMEDLLGTLSAYRRFFLRYYQWLDLGDEPVQMQYQQSLQTLEQRLTQHRTQYEGNLDFPAYNFFEAEKLMQQANRTPLAQTWARVALALIGILAALQARCLWQSEKRIVGGRLLAGIAVASVAGVAVLAGIFSAFAGGVLPALVAWLAGVFWCALWPLRRVTKPLLARVLLPLCGTAAVVMAVVAWRGPVQFWNLFWTSPGARSELLVLLLGLVYLGNRQLVAAFACLPAQTRIAQAPARYVWCINGFLLMALAAVFAVVGLDTLVTAINAELVVLPEFLVRIHGIVTHLNIPPRLPAMLAGLGMVMALPMLWHVLRTLRPSAMSRSEVSA
jgi:hypothetical protein